MAPIIERRSTKFVEDVSIKLITISAIGAFLILFDPRITLDLWGQTFIIGGDGFSAELKGAVVTLIIIGGFTAVSKYWLDSNAESAKKNDTIKSIATASATTDPPSPPPAASPAQPEKIGP